MLVIKNVSKAFGQRKVLDKVSLTLQKGKVYALIGASGSGKTTLLNTIARLEAYQSGSISYDGKELSQMKRHQFYRDYLGYLFQNAGLMESHTVRDNLDLSFVGQACPKKEREKKQVEVLKQVRLPYIELDQPIFTLSGGEAQRVALAKLILKNPPIVLADEPTASLDPKNEKEVIDLLLRLKSPERILIMATHSPQIWQKADEVIRLDELAC